MSRPRLKLPPPQARRPRSPSVGLAFVFGRVLPVRPFARDRAVLVVDLHVNETATRFREINGPINGSLFGGGGCACPASAHFLFPSSPNATGILRNKEFSYVVVSTTPDTGSRDGGEFFLVAN